MRRLLQLAVLACAAVSVPVGGASAAGVNLVANPGFEDARHGDHSVVWAWA
ncbi:hypothetical protein AB0B66_13395 [Catellatospora sp. NPDC049111]|uniref:hypothetical protein n=1 Tax=Catellatospora sp. NPDC049111 TaxID=3155271 RepID=UPI003403DE4D